MMTKLSSNDIEQGGQQAFDMYFLDIYPGQVFLKNTLGQYTYVNSAVEKAYQCSDDQFFGLSIEQTPFSIFAPCYSLSDNKAMELGQYECVEPCLNNGRIYSALSKKILLQDSNGDTTGLLAFLDPIIHTPTISKTSIETLDEIPIDDFISKTFFGGITARQQEVLYLMIRGQSASNIAINLGISQSTVIGHIDTLKVRLGADSKQGLIEAAFDMGFIHFTPERFRGDLITP